MSLRDKILSSDDSRRESVDVSGWGVIEVRSMSIEDRALFQEHAVGQRDGRFADFYIDLLIGCCYDPETGSKLFTRADADLLRKKDGSNVDQLAQVALRISGLTEDAIDQGKDGS